MSESFEALRAVAVDGAIASILPHRIANRRQDLIEITPPGEEKNNGAHSIYVGIFMTNVYNGVSTGNAHDMSYGNELTQSTIPLSSSSTFSSAFAVGTSASIDDIWSRELNTKALRLNNGYSSFGAAFHPISYDANGVVLQPYSTPLAGYNGIRALVTPTGSTFDAQKYRQKHVLDAIRSDIVRIRANLPTEARSQLEAHLGAIEQAYDAKGFNGVNPPSLSCSIPSNSWSNSTNTYGTNMSQFLDLIKMGYMCGTHRVAVLGLNPDRMVGNTPWAWTDVNGIDRLGLDPILGTNGYHHDVAHHCTDGGNGQRASEGALTWHLQKLAAFMQDLKNTVDLNGKSMLDNTIILLTGEVGDGTHEIWRRNYYVFGGKTYLKTGKFLNFGTREIPQMYTNKSLGVPEIADPNSSPNLSVKLCYNNGRGTCVVGAKTTADILAGLSNAIGIPMTSFGFKFRNTSPIDFTS